MSQLISRLIRPSSRMVCAGLVAVLFAGCSGGNDALPEEPPAPAAARVEIVQTGLLLTARGESRQLQARVLAADGTALTTPVSWSSSDDTDISVDAAGLAVAQSGGGSSQIVAAVGELRSAPLLAVVTAVADGTVLVSDEQIVRGAVETDPDAEPSLDNTYTVIVSGIEAPAEGTLIAGTGSEPLAGRVVSTRPVTGGVEITLKLAPLPELFPELEINQVFDLSQAPVEIPESIAADYLVEREGDTFSFTPRAAAKAGAAAGTSTLAKGCTTSIPDFQEGSPLPIAIVAPPVIRVTVNPSLDVLYTRARGLEKLLLKFSPIAAVEGGLNVVAAFEGKVECKADLFVFRVPVGGALSFLISGLVPVGVSLEAGGKITVATMGIGFKNETKFNAALGMQCAGECDFVGDITDFTNVVTPRLDLPGIGDLRVEPSVLASATVTASLGNPFLKSFRFNGFEAKAGPRLLGSFAPQLTQITDTTYKSNYRLAAEFKAGLGTGIQGVLNLLGIVKLNGLEFIAITDLAKSPVGKLSADQARFVTGDTVQFQLALEPATTEFLSVYNVGEILLIRNSGGRREVARATAGDGQTDFSFTFVAPDAGSSSEFVAFVVTRLLPLELLSLELDQARGASGATLLRARVDAEAGATNCAPRTECTNATNNIGADDSLNLPARDRYQISTGPTVGINTSASAQATLDVPIGADGTLSTVALGCTGDANIVRVSGLDFAISNGIARIAFEVPAGSPMRYSIGMPQLVLPVTAFAGSNVFLALIADPDSSAFPLGAGDFNNIFNLFRDEGDPRRANAPFLFGVAEGITAFDPIAEQGSRDGTLAPGRYSLVAYCFSGGGTGSGTAAHDFQATLTLSPGN